MPRKIDISYRTIVFIAVFGLGLWVIYLILDLLLLLLVALILMSALAPLVTFFTSYRLPKPLAIVIVYIISFSVIGIVLAGMLPPLIEQSNKLIKALPSLALEQFHLQDYNLSFLQSGFSQIPGNILSIVFNIFGNIITIILLLVITFYLLMEREDLERRLAEFFVGREERVRSLLGKIQEKLGAWFRGQLLLTLIIGTFTYLSLTILSIPYALPLALLAGIMEVVPVIGPIIAAIPALVVASTISPILIAGVAAAYFLIQQFENNLIVPQVMKRAVGLNPLVVILAIAVGSRLLGVGGALLAVPITVIIQVLVGDLLKDKKVE